MEEDEREEIEDEVYDDEGREDLVRNDEISPEEEAFMQGYEEVVEKEDTTSKEVEDAYDSAFEEGSSKKKKK